MRVDLNITFQALHCDDVHVNAFDIADNETLPNHDPEDTIRKTRLHLNGSQLSTDEITSAFPSFLLFLSLSISSS